MATADNTLAPARSGWPMADSPWLRIPLLAMRLLWRHWPALVFWFFAQRLGYDLLRAASLQLAERSILLAYAAVAGMIVTTLACTIAMFLLLRPSLTAVAPMQPPAPMPGAATPSARSQWSYALGIAILPFFAYYATWGLLDGIRQDFLRGYNFSVSFDARERFVDILSVKGLWVALLVSGAIRQVAKWRATSTKRLFWNVLATACEAYWIFVGATAIAALLGWAKGWWHATVAWQAITGWWENPFVFNLSLAPLRALVEPVWAVLRMLGGAMLLPLVWLALAALVYGIDLRRRQALDRADHALDRLSERYTGLHMVWRKLIGKASAGWNSKGVPVVNSVRLVMRAGLPALITLCTGWQLLDYLDSWAWAWLMRQVGPVNPHDWATTWSAQVWQALISGPFSLRPTLVTQMLRAVLLAATLDCALVRLKR